MKKYTRNALLILGIFIAGLSTQAMAQEQTITVENHDDNGPKVKLEIKVQTEDGEYRLKAERTEDGNTQTFEKTYSEEGAWHEDAEFQEFAGENWQGDRIRVRHLREIEKAQEEVERAHEVRIHVLDGTSEELHQELEQLREAAEAEGREVQVRVFMEDVEANEAEKARLHEELARQHAEGENEFQFHVIRSDEDGDPVEIRFHSHGEEGAMQLTGNNFVWKTEDGVQIILHSEQGEVEVLEFSEDAIEKADLQNGKPFAPDALTLFPNPSTGDFNLRLENDLSQHLQVRVINLSGQEVFNQTFDKESGALEAKIDLNGQESGIYILQAIQGDYVSTRKIVLK